MGTGMPPNTCSGDRIRRFPMMRMKRIDSEEAKDPVICKDVKEFSVTCYDCEEETQTEWDSDENIGKYATPRAVGIKLSVSDGETAHIFQTTVTTPVYREKIEEEMKGP